VFTTGDNAYDAGTAAEFTNCYHPSWGRHRPRTRPVPGNHEYATPGAAGYYGYFGDLARDPAKGYYAYDVGPWRVYALNSNCAAVGGCEEGSPQETWLENDLAANPSECIAAYWHHPRYSSGDHGSHPMMEPFWQDLTAAGAEFVLSGHDHGFERFAPIGPNGAAAASGMTQFVVGTGGRSHYPYGPTGIAHSLVRNGDTYGVLRIDLGPSGYSWRFVPEPGKRDAAQA